MKARTFFIITILLFLFSSSIATTYKSLTVDEIIQRTDIAFHATVTEVVVEVREDANGQTDPWTKVSFEILEALKGDVVGTHSLYFYGGSSEEKTLQVEAMPVFRVSDELLVFAYDATYYSPLVGFSQGLFRLDEGTWQNESGMWLMVDEDGFRLADEAFEDGDAVFSLLREVLSSKSSQGLDDANQDLQDSDTNSEDGGQ